MQRSMFSVLCLFSVCSLSYIPVNAFSRAVKSDSIAFIHTELNKSDLWIQSASQFFFILHFIEREIRVQTHSVINSSRNRSLSSHKRVFIKLAIAFERRANFSSAPAVVETATEGVIVPHSSRATAIHQLYKFSIWERSSVLSLQVMFK